MKCLPGRDCYLYTDSSSSVLSLSTNQYVVSLSCCCLSFPTRMPSQNFQQFKLCSKQYLSCAIAHPAIQMQSSRALARPLEKPQRRGLQRRISKPAKRTSRMQQLWQLKHSQQGLLLRQPMSTQRSNPGSNFNHICSVHRSTVLCAKFAIFLHHSPGNLLTTIVIVVAH